MKDVKPKPLQSLASEKNGENLFQNANVILLDNQISQDEYET